MAGLGRTFSRGCGADDAVAAAVDDGMVDDTDLPWAAAGG